MVSEGFRMRKFAVLLAVMMTMLLPVASAVCSEIESGRTAIGAGVHQNCILTSDGNVICEGSNSRGQAADYANGDAMGVASGHSHNCVLQSSGNVH